MATLRELMLERIYNLLHELLRPLDILRTSSVLKDEVPMAISEQVRVVGRISDQFIEEVVDLREHVQQRIDLSSPVEAAAQIRRLASGWREYKILLLNAIHQIQASGVRTGDELLDRIMVETLPGGLEELERMMSLLEDIGAEFLTAPLCNGTERLKRLV